MQQLKVSIKFQGLYWNASYNASTFCNYIEFFIAYGTEFDPQQSMHSKVLTRDYEYDT